MLLATSASGAATTGAHTSGLVGGALSALEQPPGKGRAPKRGYARSQFGVAWTDENTALWGRDSLSTRENILSRVLNQHHLQNPLGANLAPCVVQAGTLKDPHTGVTLNFVRGEKTSPLVPIDHVVALSES